MAEAKPFLETNQELSLVCPSDIIFCRPGDDAVLSCNLVPAISAASMEIQWWSKADLVCHYKDGQMIESCGGRVSLSLEDLHKGNVSLILRDVRTSQRGIYICKVIHEHQAIKEYIFLHVNFISLEVPNSTIYAYPGEDVVLPVHLLSETSAVSMDIRWFRGTELIYQYNKGQKETCSNYENRVNLFVQELERGNLSLTLRNVQPSDSGEYTCTVIKDGYQKTGIVHLHVRELQMSENTLKYKYLSNTMGKILEEMDEICKPEEIDDLIQPLNLKEKSLKEIQFPHVEQLDKLFRQIKEAKRKIARLNRLIQELETKDVPSVATITLHGPTLRRGQSMEGIPPLLERESSDRQTQDLGELSTEITSTRDRTQAQENPRATMQRTQDNVATEPERFFPAVQPQIQERERPSESEGPTLRRGQSMEGIPPLLERESSDRQTQDLGELSTEITSTRDRTQAQENPRATMQRTQDNVATEPERSFPAVQPQIQERERPSEGSRTQRNTRERPENRAQQKQEKKCQIL
ncbi:uncharacterized protein LOC113042105 isoform X2 [Carassius auratus]|uniref:Uncharacterized protein LOC113042105 isoform X2 n=1 Tax=Carassius auratus TaxID=7957 RepID=A0A6P6JEH6_CARAU|nr:uncharacterized protein LOC113042105 isoform X2 [Carassius auratus]